MLDNNNNNNICCMLDLTCECAAPGAPARTMADDSLADLLPRLLPQETLPSRQHAAHALAARLARDEPLDRRAAVLASALARWHCS